MCTSASPFEDKRRDDIKKLCETYLANYDVLFKVTHLENVIYMSNLSQRFSGTNRAIDQMGSLPMLVFKNRSKPVDGDAFKTELEELSVGEPCFGTSEPARSE
uniref:SFRICE_015475 n=1 Tax=Spodoptera frugiperda TaxID=7108 RepID=A0A2H1W119_SPOFR